MKAKASTNSIPKVYRDAIERVLADQQEEIARRLILSACLVGSDAFGWNNEDCNKFARCLSEILQGYNEEIYRCRNNIGKIEDLRLSFIEELRNRGIVVEGLM